MSTAASAVVAKVPSTANKVVADVASAVAEFMDEAASTASELVWRGHIHGIVIIVTLIVVVHIIIVLNVIILIIAIIIIIVINTNVVIIIVIIVVNIIIIKYCYYCHYSRTADILPWCAQPKIGQNVCGDTMSVLHRLAERLRGPPKMPKNSPKAVEFAPYEDLRGVV